MSMRIGQGSTIQAGFESAWGTPVSPAFNISHKSESLKYVADKKEEDSLVGGRASRGVQTLGSKVEGDISFIAKPDELGAIIAWSLGEEAATVEEAIGATRHTFAPVKSGSAPKATVIIDRKVGVDKYVSCKVDSLKLSGSAGGFLDGSVSLRGYDEQTGVLGSISKSEVKALRFVDAAVSINGADYGPLVQSFSVDIANSLESELYTLESGKKMSELEFGKLEVSASLELLYETDGQALHANQYKSDTEVSLVITLTSAEDVVSGTPYELKISLPLAQIKESSFNLGDSGRIKQSLSFQGLEDDDNSAIEIDVVDAQAAAYLA